MKKEWFLWVILLFTTYSEGKAQAISALKSWSLRPAEERGTLTEQAFARQALSRQETMEASTILDSLWRQEMQERYADSWKKGVFILDSLQMKIGGRIYGEKPEDGRNLYISMHGGGNAPTELNNQQWTNQISLYRPQEGVYIAPRAPWDDWDMWFKPGMDELLETLIGSAVALLDVNPDKVYLLGYSAGGDGVWRLAPRMADRWAAASMMAGHPGNTSQINLRNLPYMIWMGEQDAAYNRNRLAVERGRVLDSLQQTDPSGYIHATHIMAGKGHWMDQADTAAITWTSQFHRNPYPPKVVWRQEEVARPSLYWLSVPAAEQRMGMTVIAEYKDNEINILSCDYSRLIIGLNDSMMNLDQPVTVKYQGKVLFHGQTARSIANLSRTLALRKDLRYMFPAIVEIQIP